MNTNKRSQNGFTLLELLIVLLIIGLLAGYVAPKVVGKGDQTRKIAALRQINALESALNEYRIDNGAYPTIDQGLKALINKPESEPVPKNWKRYWSKRTLPKDPWGREYQYRNPGEKEDIDVFSMGKDTDSDNDDIGNWDSDSTTDKENQDQG